MHSVEKWVNIHSTSCGMNTAKISEYVWPFCNIMHKRVLLIEGNSHVLSNLLFN